MTQLRRLESNKDDPTQGGILFTFPSGKHKLLQWETKVPIEPTLDAAKKYAAEVLNSIGIETDDARFTNWASVTAAIQKIVKDFNDALVAHHHENSILIGDGNVFASAGMGPNVLDPGKEGSLH